MSRRLPAAERMTAPPPRPPKYRELGPTVSSGVDLRPPVVSLGPGGGSSSVRLTAFPTPSRKNFNWKNGVEYWKKVYDDPALRGRLKIYVYRGYPSMLEGRRQVAILSGSPDTTPELSAAPMNKLDVLHRFGSGDYSFWINDDDASGRHRQVCKVYLKNDTEMRQWEDYPAVLNIEDVDPDDPVNESFLRRARVSQHYQTGGEGGTAMEKKVEEMQRRVDRMKEEKHQQELDVMRAQLTGDQSTQSQAVSVMADASKAAIEIVKGQSGGGNQMEMIKAVLGVVKEMKPQEQAGPNPQVMLLMDELKTAREEAARAREANSTMLLESLKAMRENVQEAKANVEPPKTFAEQLQEFKAMQDVISPRRSSSAGEESGWMSIAPMVISAVGPLVSSITAYLAASAQRQGVPQATVQQIASPPVPQGPPGNMMDPTQQALPIQDPNAPPVGNAMDPMQGRNQSQAQEVPQDPTAPPATPMGQQPTPQGGSVQPQHTGEVNVTPEEAAKYPEEFKTFEGIAAFLNELASPLIRHLKDPDASGLDFAEWYIGWKGEEHYDKLTEFSPGDLMQIVGQHPGIMQAAQESGADLQQFIVEFCSDPPDDGDETPAEGVLTPEDEELAKVGGEAIATAAEIAEPDDKPKPVRRKKPPAKKAAKKVVKKAARKVARKAA